MNRIFMNLKINTALAAGSLLLLLNHTTLQNPPSRPALQWDAFFEKPASFTSRDRRASRHVLTSGAVAFFVADPSAPIIDIRVAFRAGSYLDRNGKEGLSRILADCLRFGGTKGRTPGAVEAELASAGATLQIDICDTNGFAELRVPAANVELAAAVLFDILRQPAFVQSSLDHAKARLLAMLAARNDDTETAVRREWKRAARGNHYSTRLPSTESILSITRDDAAAAGARFLFPKNFIISAGGDFRSEQLIQIFEDQLKGWASADTPLPVPPEIETPGAPGIYLFDAGTLQNSAAVAVGFLTTKRDHDDRVALGVLLEHLLSPAAAGKIERALRIERSIASNLKIQQSTGDWFADDAVIYATCQAKSATATVATILEEFRKLQVETLPPERLAFLKQCLLDRSVISVGTSNVLAAQFAYDELVRADPEEAQRYRERLLALTPDDCLRAARRYFEPQKAIILIAGNRKKLEACTPALSTFGNIKIVELD
ncbi:MAG: M16 family metallopeptidase [Planctomycetota bacterium]